MGVVYCLVRFSRDRVQAGELVPFEMCIYNMSCSAFWPQSLGVFFDEAGMEVVVPVKEEDGSPICFQAQGLRVFQCHFLADKINRAGVKFQHVTMQVESPCHVSFQLDAGSFYYADNEPVELWNICASSADGLEFVRRLTSTFKRHMACAIDPVAPKVEISLGKADLVVGMPAVVRLTFRNDTYYPIRVDQHVSCGDYAEVIAYEQHIGPIPPKSSVEALVHVKPVSLAGQLVVEASSVFDFDALNLSETALLDLNPAKTTHEFPVAAQSPFAVEIIPSVVSVSTAHDLEFEMQIQMYLKSLPGIVVSRALLQMGAESVDGRQVAQDLFSFPHKHRLSAPSSIKSSVKIAWSLGDGAGKAESSFEFDLLLVEPMLYARRVKVGDGCIVYHVWNGLASRVTGFVLLENYSGQSVRQLHMDLRPCEKIAVESDGEAAKVRITDMQGSMYGLRMV